MNIKQLTNQMKDLKKFFVDTSGEIIATSGLHEQLARDICQEKGWDWQSSGKYSCEDFLLEKGYVKFSNYGPLKYVAVSRKFYKDRTVMDHAYFLADTFNLKLEVY